MPAYKLSLTPPDDDVRQQVLTEIDAFLNAMYGRELAVVTLDEEQSTNWDKKCDLDYQDYYGQEIIRQVADGVTQALVIRSDKGLPLALALRDEHGNWEGIGIAEGLRQQVTTMMFIPEDELE